MQFVANNILLDNGKRTLGGGGTLLSEPKIWIAIKKSIQGGISQKNWNHT